MHQNTPFQVKKSSFWEGSIAHPQTLPRCEGVPSPHTLPITSLLHQPCVPQNSSQIYATGVYWHKAIVNYRNEHSESALPTTQYTATSQFLNEIIHVMRHHVPFETAQQCVRRNAERTTGRRVGWGGELMQLTEQISNEAKRRCDVIVGHRCRSRALLSAVAHGYQRLSSETAQRTPARLYYAACR